MEVSTKLFNAQATKNFSKINEQLQAQALSVIKMIQYFPTQIEVSNQLAAGIRTSRYSRIQSSQRVCRAASCLA